MTRELSPPILMMQHTLRLLLLCVLPALSFGNEARTEDPLRVFIRAGAKTHGPGEHDHPRFLEEWSELLRERGASVAGALSFPTAGELAKTDVMVLFAADAGAIHEYERSLLADFLGRGGGLVVLHDAVCGDAPQWFKTVVGGAWEHGHSKWHVGEMGLYFADREHPITRGVSNFDFTDELYYDLHLDPRAHVLANSFRTTHEIRPQMWVFEQADYRAFVSIPGHFHETFSHGPYRTLLLRGIAWAGKRDADLLISEAESAALRYPAGGPRRPAAALEALEAHEDFEVTTVAAEPLVINPISIDWDPDGRMWVATTPGYPFKEEFSGIAPHDEILILVDTDGDGRMDSRKVFYEGLDLVTSLVFHRDGVIVTQAPEILFLRDTDGDDVADVREVLFSGFGYRDTHATASNMRWGLDGWIYATQGYSGGASKHIVGPDGVDHGKIGNGLFRFRPDGSAIEMVVSYGSNTWGCDFSWDGELFFTMANGSHLRHVIAPDRVLDRGRIGGVSAWKDITDHKKAFPTAKHERNPYVQIDFVGGFTGAAGCLIYGGGAWPREYWGDHLVTEPTINIVHRDRLEPRGATFNASRVREREFIGSHDLWFRPVHLRTGPDGALYVLDFYNQAAVHNDTRGPRHGPTNAALRPDRDRHHGRILRVQHRQARVLTSSVGRAPAELVEALEHPNRWARMSAQRLLCEAEELPTEILTALEPGARTSERARVHGLWTLTRRGGLTEGVLLSGMDDAVAGVRKNAARIAGSWSGGGEGIGDGLAVLLADVGPRVALEAAIALGRRGVDEAGLAALVARYPDLPDDWSRSVFVGAAGEAPCAAVAAALAHPRAVELESFIGELAHRIGNGRDPERVAHLVIILGDHAETRPSLVRVALSRLAGSLHEIFAPTDGPRLQAALAALLSATDVDAARGVLPFAARWADGAGLARHVARLSERLIETLEDEEQSLAMRAECLRTLLAVADTRAAAIEAAPALLRPHVPLDLQLAVIEMLGDTGDVKAARVMLSSFPAFTTKLREATFHQFLPRSPWVDVLLDLVADDELCGGDLGPGRVFRLCSHPDPAIADRASSLLAVPDESDTLALAELIEALVPIVSVPGDKERGELLFNTHCGTCHTFKSASGKVGPELTGMGVHEPADLLPFVLDPNRTVEDGYVEYIARTWDGLSYGGVLVRESDEFIVLRNSGGDVELAREDIQNFACTGRSPMPTGLERIGAEGLRDILTWLRSEFTGYRVLDLSAVATANTEIGLYDPREPRTLEFTRFGVHAAGGVPFAILDPARSLGGNNAIVLKGGLAGDWFCKTHQPSRVEIPIGYAIERLHVLGGISAWGFPFTKKRAPAVRVTWHYSGGDTEVKTLIDGEEFADWIRPHDVPGSEEVTGILDEASRGQLRRFALAPLRGEVIEKVVLESFDGDTAPTFLALTAELPDGEVAAAPDGPAALDAAILVVGGGSSHDFQRWFAGTDVGTLSKLGAGVAYTDSVDTLSARIEGLDLLVLSNNQPFPADARAAIETFVEAGGGLLLVHPACWYNWSEWPAYNRELVSGGARSHEPYREFEVRVTAPGHALTEGLPVVFRITDELYRFIPDEAGPAIEVLVTGRSLETGEEYPVVWSVEREAGRTVCITLGHDGAAHEHPGFQRLLWNAARWSVAEDGR
ncbi:MAG: ThuA domain-containing protein [Planctomycetota bacterium]|jgi:putative membrane-bound dehydrogenase-like protein|nr:ThuA domain-containing protein [Planctomycetota bacterium]